MIYLVLFSTSCKRSQKQNTSRRNGKRPKERKTGGRAKKKELFIGLVMLGDHETNHGKTVNEDIHKKTMYHERQRKEPGCFRPVSACFSSYQETFKFPFLSNRVRYGVRFEAWDYPMVTRMYF